MDITLSETLAMDRVQNLEAQVLFSVIDAHRQHLRPWMSWVDATTSVADSEAFLQCITQQYHKDLSLHYAIISEGHLCGVCGFNKIDNENRIGIIGYWLTPPFTGKGIMTRCVNELLNIGFNERALHKIELRCAEHNHKSRAIAQRLGFINEATLRDCEWLYTRHVNHTIYSKLATEH